MIVLAAIILLMPVPNPKIPGFLYTYPGGFSTDPHRTEYGCGIPPDQDVREECDYSPDQRGMNKEKSDGTP